MKSETVKNCSQGGDWKLGKVFLGSIKSQVFGFLREKSTHVNLFSYIKLWLSCLIMAFSFSNLLKYQAEFIKFAGISKKLANLSLSRHS